MHLYMYWSTIASMLPSFSYQPDSYQWMQFKHQIVRELAFCIASPPLMRAWPNKAALNRAIDLPSAEFWQTQFQHYLTRLKQLDQNPFELEQHLLSARSSRLGIRFEHLLTFWLLDDQYHCYTLIGQSIKRMDGTRTLGELDFLLRNRTTGQIEHWEVAIKFYLGESEFFAEQWLGLNRRDSLGRKINHLQQHQFNSDHISGQTIETRRAIIKGRLFYPVDRLVTSTNFDSTHQDINLAASWISHQHLKGAWGTVIPSTPLNYTWRRAQRLEWITPNASAKPLTTAAYWNSGLYFLLDRQNSVVFHYVLRIVDKRYSPFKNNNILQPNTYADDIFKRISIR